MQTFPLVHALASIAILAWGALPSHLTAQDADVLLPPTYQVGKSYLFQTDQHIEVPLAMGPGGNPDAKQVAQFSIIISADCAQDPADPALRIVTASITRATTSIKMGNVVMTYDSDDPNSQENILSDAFEGVTGERFEFTLDAEDEIVAATGFTKLEGGNNFMQVRFGPEQLKQLMLPAIRFGVPAEGATAGTEWKNDVNLNFGPTGNVDAAYTYQYVGDKEGTARLEYTADLKVDVKTAGGEKDPKMKMEMKDGAIKGYMNIDKALRFPKIGVAEISAQLTTDHPLDPTQKLQLPLTMIMGFELLEVK